MSKKEKREEKIRANPRNVSLADFEWLAQQHGTLVEGGNHPQIVIGYYKISYKKTNPIKVAYVRQLLEAIDQARKMK